MVRQTLLALALGAGLWPALGVAQTVDVFAAASLKEALDEVAQAYESQSQGQMRISYGGSSSLARQIEYGAPAEIFVSANVAWMDHLQEAGRVAADGRVTLLGNELVMIGPAYAAPVELARGADLFERLGDGVMAVALVDAVPAGQYAKAAFSALGFWPDLESRLAQTDNVRAALALVASGAAPLGVVYATDAAAEPRVSVVARFEEGSHPPIRYPMALTTAAGDDARAMFDFLRSASAAAIFRAHGFSTIEEMPQ